MDWNSRIFLSIAERFCVRGFGNPWSTLSAPCLFIFWFLFTFSPVFVFSIRVALVLPFLFKQLGSCPCQICCHSLSVSIAPFHPFPFCHFPRCLALIWHKNTYTYITLHYITLHCIALHYIAYIHAHIYGWMDWYIDTCIHTNIHI